MLLEGFYHLLSIENNGKNTYSARIRINALHDVFKGHFPGNPVTPGVCMMHVIKEVAQKIVDVPLVLISASNVKFTAVINPQIHPELRLEIEVIDSLNGQFKIKNLTYFDDTVALKLNCIFAKR